MIKKSPCINQTDIPSFQTWRHINASLLLTGKIKILASGELQIQFILWDTILDQPMIHELFTLSKKLWRRAAHKISDTIYHKITGYQGYFNTRITYISESGRAISKTQKTSSYYGIKMEKIINI